MKRVYLKAEDLSENISEDEDPTVSDLSISDRIFNYFKVNTPSLKEVKSLKVSAKSKPFI